VGTAHLFFGGVQCGPTIAEYGFTTFCLERLILNPPLADFLPTRLGLKIWNPHRAESLDGLTIPLKRAPYIGGGCTRAVKLDFESIARFPAKRYNAQRQLLLNLSAVGGLTIHRSM